MVRIASIITLWILWSGIALATQAERRTAEATFHEQTECRDVWTTLTLTQASAPLEQVADGWLRSALLTVEVSDTCLGVQLLNAAGQTNMQPQELAVDRKLDSAFIQGWLYVWDGISQSTGRFWVQASWTGVGTLTRSGRNLVRSAEATLAADGFGLQLRNATQEGQLSTEIVK